MAEDLLFRNPSISYMGRPVRFLPPECPLVEVTCRTLQGRLLLRPSRQLNAIVRGVVARAARLYAMRVCAFVFLSNHYHLLLRPRDASHLASFMNYLNGNLAKEAGRLHRWREKFWGRRYRSIPVSFEPEAQVERLRYLLEQGCKENLVARPQDWPGASCLDALLTGKPIRGVWYDRTQEYRARRRGQRIDPEEFAAEDSLELAPLPCWEELDAEEVRLRVEEILERIIEETAQRHRANGVRPLGRRQILRQRPDAWPRRVQRSPAPRFHAASLEIRRMLEAMYRAFLDLRADALEALREGRLPVRFPAHGIPPPLASAVGAV